MTLVFRRIQDTIRLLVGVDDSEKDGRNEARAAARKQVAEAREEAAASKKRRELSVFDAQYNRRVAGRGRG